MAELEVYLKNIRERWIKEVAAADEVLIFSPYITNSTAQAVCKSEYAEKCTIYTGFTYPLFLYGSSDTRALLALIKSGARIFKLPKLHAKMVIVPEVFASVGSQNLTLQGTKNLEGTLSVTDEKTVGKIERQARKWAELATELSEEEIQDMENLVAPFRKKLKQLMKDVGGVDEEVERLEEEREAERKRLSEDAERGRREKEEQKRKEDEELARNRVRQFREKVQNIARYSYPISVHVKYIGGNTRYRHALVARRNDQQINEFIIDGERKKLIRLRRYMILDADSAAVGWVRLGDKRATRFSSGIVYGDPIKLGDVDYKLIVRGKRHVDLDAPANIEIEVRHKWWPVCVICEAWFTVDSLIIQGVSVGSSGNEERSASLVDSVKSEYKKDLERIVLERVLYPLRFKEGEKLSGSTAEEYFVPGKDRKRLNRYFKLRAVDLNGSIALVVSDS